MLLDNFQMIWTYGCGSDGKSGNVRDGSDCYGDARVAHSQGHPLRNGSLLLVASQVVQGLDDNEHVVDSDAQQKERNGGVNGSVKYAQIEAESVRGQNGLAHHRNADYRQQQLPQTNKFRGSKIACK